MLTECYQTNIDDPHQDNSYLTPVTLLLSVPSLPSWPSPLSAVVPPAYASLLPVAPSPQSRAETARSSRSLYRRIHSRGSIASHASTLQKCKPTSGCNRAELALPECRKRCYGRNKSCTIRPKHFHSPARGPMEPKPSR